MASKQTENYGLSQWEASDQVVRLDFNSDNAKIDAGMAENKVAAAAAQETADNLAAVAFTPENLPFVVGTYTGNSQEVNSNSNTQDILLGFTPRLVAVFRGLGNSTSQSGSSAFAMATEAVPFYWNQKYIHLEIIENGFRVGSPYSSSTAIYPSLNMKETVFPYLALK